MRNNEQSKRLPSEAFSFDNATLTSDRMLYVGLLSYDRSQLLSPHPLVPGFFKTEINPDEPLGVEKQAREVVSRHLQVRALTSVAALHVPEQPEVRGYLLGAASPRLSPEHFETLDAFTHEDIRATLEMFQDTSLEHTRERQLLSILGHVGCRYIVH